MLRKQAMKLASKATWNSLEVRRVCNGQGTFSGSRRGRAGKLRLRQAAVPPKDAASRSSREKSDRARPRYGPEEIYRIFPALSGVLKVRPGAVGPRFGRGRGAGGREGVAPITKQPETTLKQNAVERTEYKRETKVFFFLTRSPLYCVSNPVGRSCAE